MALLIVHLMCIFAISQELDAFRKQNVISQWSIITLNLHSMALINALLTALAHLIFGMIIVGTSTKAAQGAKSTSIWRNCIKNYWRTGIVTHHYLGRVIMSLYINMYTHTITQGVLIAQCDERMEAIESKLKQMSTFLPALKLKCDSVTSQMQVSTLNVLHCVCMYHSILFHLKNVLCFLCRD